MLWEEKLKKTGDHGSQAIKSLDTSKPLMGLTSLQSMELAIWFLKIKEKELIIW
jgi:hypothetical protein